MDLQNKRILIVKPSSLGDIVHTLPLVHAFKRCRPDCRIGWVVQQAFAAIPASDPAVDAVYPIRISSTSDPRSGHLAYWHAFRDTVRTYAELRRAFRQQPYDLVLDLQASFRSGLLGWANPGGIRIGFADARELNPLFQNQRIKVPSSTVHAVEKNLLFSSHLDCPSSREDFRLYCSADDEQRVDAFLAGQEIAEEVRLIYVNPAARWKTKFWLPERWAELGDRLIGEYHFQVIFGGSRKDEGYISTIAGKMVHSPVVAAGRLTLSETTSLLKRSAAYVGLDSGPMHMAAMAGIPVAALFGPTHPERVGPYGVEHSIIQAPGLDCLGCRKRICSHMSCMKGITVDRVCGSLLRLLKT
jgi:lipopolysaccharide heptosyltransferase I